MRKDRRWLAGTLLSLLAMVAFIAAISVPGVARATEPDAQRQAATTQSQAITGDAKTPVTSTVDAKGEEAAESSETTAATNSNSKAGSSQAASVATTSAVVEEASKDAVEYVYVDQQNVAVGDTQNIVLGLSSADAQVTSAKLELTASDGLPSLSFDASKVSGNAMLFSMSFKDDQTASYTVNKLTYTLKGSDFQHVVAFADGEGSASFEVLRSDTARAFGAAPSSDEGVSAYFISEDGSISSADSVADALARSGTNASSDTSSNARSITRPLGNHIIVAIDPGHGGWDPGAQSNGLSEANLTLKIASYMKQELETYAGVSVYMTRTSDTYVGLQERVDNAVAKGADVFVSVHINSEDSGRAYGAEVWVPRSGSYNGSTHTIGEGLGSKILGQLGNLGLYERGVKTLGYIQGGGSPDSNSAHYSNGDQADYYSVIRNARKAGIPGIIVEHAFITNDHDANFMKSESNLRNLGIADATGVAQQYGLSRVDDVRPQSLVAVHARTSKFGWENWVFDGQVGGSTSGSQDLTGLNVNLYNAAAAPGNNVQYSVGANGSWSSYVYGGTDAVPNGTIQAVKIRLVGNAAQKYDIYYRLYTRQYGWMGWAKNDSPAGALGTGDRAQAIQIAVVPKGSSAPGSTENPYQEYKAPKGGTPIYRLYNPYSGMHHYTTDLGEYQSLQGIGWKGEGVSFSASADAKSGSPVYRLYNKYSGQHLWTMDKREYDQLVRLGWNGEDVAWYQPKEAKVSVYRLYNKYSHEHLYTTYKSEYDRLVKLGWNGEGESFKGL